MITNFVVPFLFFIIINISKVFFCAIIKTEYNCISKGFGHGSNVCVCNTSFCDYLELDLNDLNPNELAQISSNKNGKRFETKIFNTSSDFYPNQTNTFVLEINSDMKFQSIFGFGGAFTDSTGINLSLMPPALKNHVLDSYFSSKGLSYNLGRVPIAGTDFSDHGYSYDDFLNDTNLKHFSLTKEDFLYKIPYISEALSRNSKIKLISCPWSAPKWMKSNNDYIGKGFLKTEYYESWANYLIKFLEEYKMRNISFWAISAQNEPIDGLIPNFSFNCMGWKAVEQRDWIKYFLGPKLVTSKHSNVKILIFDDQRPLLSHWLKIILDDADAAKYISGIGLHWYMNFYPVSTLDSAHKNYPNFFLLSTEASNGPLEEAVILGSWERGESYAHDIINNLNHWVTGWIDWNLVLNLEGGPNWAKNFVDSPIIFDSSQNVFYKQPMFYAMGHFSKWIVENSIRVHSKIILSDSQNSDSEKFNEVFGFESVSTERPDGKIVTVILNKLSDDYFLKIIETSKKKKLKTPFIVKIGGRSISTIVY